MSQVFFLNRANKPNKFKEKVPTDIADKEERKGIITIAESIYNVSTGGDGLE